MSKRDRIAAMEKEGLRPKKKTIKQVVAEKTSVWNAFLSGEGGFEEEDEIEAEIRRAKKRKTSLEQIEVVLDRLQRKQASMEREMARLGDEIEELRDEFEKQSKSKKATQAAEQ